jgi:AraC-like DNA-binding protein
LTKTFTPIRRTENNIPKQSAYKDTPMIDLTGNVFLKGFFDSLLPYIDNPKKLTAKIAELKTCEAIELLLQTSDVFQNFLFDFQEPHKIDLEAYMNHNYKYNIPLSSFAKLTGRSLSTFKRDFIKIFETTPEKWLQQKRLEQAHFLISKKNLRPSEVYLEVGFENLSHFSFAFKKLFGLTPTELTEQKKKKAACRLLLIKFFTYNSLAQLGFIQATYLALYQFHIAYIILFFFP